MTYLTKNVYDVIKQRSQFGFEERKKEVNYMDAKVFGKFIMERRKQLGMTQAELAEKINVTDKAVSRWERGLGFPDINTLEPLADALGIEVVELMRSEINTERRETAVDRKNVVEIMKSTAEISEYHAAKKMKWLISGIAVLLVIVTMNPLARMLQLDNVIVVDGVIIVEMITISLLTCGILARCSIKKIKLYPIALMLKMKETE